MREAGCRFLEKLEREEDVWLQVSEKVAREKVSHALRDKSPVSTLTDAKSRLKRRLADPNNKTDDYHFIAANKRLLRVDLPEIDHATGNTLLALFSIDCLDSVQECIMFFSHVSRTSVVKTFLAFSAHDINGGDLFSRDRSKWIAHLW